jgi:hypothetical protein
MAKLRDGDADCTFENLEDLREKEWKIRTNENPLFWFGILKIYTFNSQR